MGEGEVEQVGVGEPQRADGVEGAHGVGEVDLDIVLAAGLCAEVGEGALEAAAGMEGFEGNELEGVFGALFAEGDEGGGAILSALVEGIDQRRAAIAQAAVGEGLGFVEVAEGDVVEGVEGAGGDLVEAADGALLGVAGLRAGDEVVGDEHIAGARVGVGVGDGGGDGVGIGFDGVVGVEFAGLGGLQEGEEVDVEAAVGIGEGGFLEDAVEDIADMDAGGGQEGGGVGELGLAVVVAANDEGGLLEVGEVGEEAAELGDGVGLGLSAVIDVAGDEDGVHIGAGGEVEDLAENVGLIVDERAAVKALAEMNVGDMQEFHLLWDLHEMMRPCVMAQGGSRDVSQNRTRGSESRVKWDHPPCGVQGQRPARRRRRLSAEQSSNRKAAATEESRGDHPLWRGSKGQRPLARLTPENAARRRMQA